MRLWCGLSMLAMIGLSPTAGQVLAQSPDGSVSGVVHDSSGAAVPGATVTVTNDQTGASQSAVSGADGSFSVDRPAARRLHGRGPAPRLRDVQAEGAGGGGRRGHRRVLAGRQAGRRGRGHRHPRRPAHGHGVDGAHRRAFGAGVRGPDRRPLRPDPDPRALLQREHPADQRRLDHRAPGLAAQPGARPHAGAHQRRAAPSRGGDLLAGQRSGRRRAGPRHLG